MRKILIASILLFSFSVTAISQQDSTKVNLSPDADTCYRSKVAPIVRMIKRDGEKAKYFYNDDIVVYMTPSSESKYPNYIRLVSIRRQLNFSLLMGPMKIIGFDSAGQVAATMIVGADTAATDMAKDVELSFCQSMSINMGNKFQIPNTVTAEIQYLTLYIKEAEGEMKIILGKVD